MRIPSNPPPPAPVSERSPARGAAEPAPRGRAALRPMVARDPAEEHRVSTPLECLFDLCFVVAVSQASTQWRHALAAGHLGTGLAGYTAVFFAIWWAWMHFTWFASVYDNDDLLYRATTLVQITGSLILAAGIPLVFAHGDFTVLAVGWGILRLGLIAHWLRAAREYPVGRSIALRYAGGLALCWAGWMLLLVAGNRLWPELAPVMVLAELAVPLLARRAGANPWHPRHIAERFGLFTLIVLGESVLASTGALQAALDGTRSGELDETAVGGLLTLFSMWWLYFARPAHRFLHSSRIGFAWGYGHLPVFSAAAAVGAGLAANVDRTTGHSVLSAHQAGAVFTVPVALFVAAVWVLQLRPHHAAAGSPLFALAAPVIAGLGFTPHPILGTGIAMTALTGLLVVTSGPAPGAVLIAEPDDDVSD
ncbi:MULTISPECIES: low temperature requirement protein A [Streptacidiphilus]|uniref:Low temperature requirement protein A n=1 Tax=Streptacidiphilus cavernicola TaxID=3342716 RepID=A0ABV6UJY0_9ACTN|nr:low temperature requirement protein A [Streptacidiphilus jeojiense]